MTIKAKHRCGHIVEVRASKKKIREIRLQGGFKLFKCPKCTATVLSREIDAITEQLRMKL